MGWGKNKKTTTHVGVAKGECPAASTRRRVSMRVVKIKIQENCLKMET